MPSAGATPHGVIKLKPSPGSSSTGPGGGAWLGESWYGLKVYGGIGIEISGRGF